jgi:MFS family permease
MLVPIYALFVEDIGGNLLAASYAFAVFAFMAGVTTLLSGRYTDRLENYRLIMALGYLLVGLGFLALTVVNSVLTLFIVQIIIGIGNAIYAPAFDAAYSEHLDSHRAGSEWGAWEAINYFTAAIGAVLGGVLVTTFGFEVMFVVMASLCFTSSLYIFRLPKKLL